MATPVCCCAVFLRVLFAQRTAGASRHPAFPAPSWTRGWNDQAKLGRNPPRGCEAVSASNASWKSAAAASYSVIASAAKQSSLPPRRDSGLLRYARNDDVERTDARLHSHAPDAAQRPFDGALQSRGPSPPHCTMSRLGPGSAQQRKSVAARPRHERVNDRAASPRHPPPPAPSPPTRSRRIAAARSRSPRLPWSRTTPRG